MRFRGRQRGADRCTKHHCVIPRKTRFHPFISHPTRRYISSYISLSILYIIFLMIRNDIICCEYAAAAAAAAVPQSCATFHPPPVSHLVVVLPKTK